MDKSIKNFQNKCFRSLKKLKSRFTKWFTRLNYVDVAKKTGMAIVTLIGVYLLVYPFFPRVIYYINKGKPYYPYKTKLNVDGTQEDYYDEDTASDLPEVNTIVIPEIRISMPIVSGDDDSALNKGVWHRPGTGVPGEGNMVLTGHRVGYAVWTDDIKYKTTFYNLDKLDVGDSIIIYWNDTEYDYIVTSFETVEPTRIDIESPTAEHRLTVYTCTPIGSTKERLVYYARLVEE